MNRRKKPFMFNRKGAVLSFVFAAPVLFLFPASFTAAQPKDVIVIVDTSTAMSSFYANVTGYLTGAFLRENLELGDTFHLISFAGKPRFEIARKIIDEGDVQTINGRIFLLYPLEPVSDVAAAVNYGERYTTLIPQGRQKKIFVISAGDGEKPVTDAAARLAASGAAISFLKAPLSAPPPGSGSQPSMAARTQQQSSSSVQTAPPRPVLQQPSGGSAAPPVSDTVRTQQQQRPAQSAQIAPPSSIPSQTDDPPRSGQAEQREQTAMPGSDAPVETADTRQSVTNPANTQTAETAAVDTPAPPETPSETTAVTPSVPSPAAAGTGRISGGGRQAFPAPLLAAGGAILLLLIGIFIFVMTKKLGSSPGKVMAAAGSAFTAGTSPQEANPVSGASAAKNADLLNSFASRQAAPQGTAARIYHRDDPNQFLSNPPMLNMFVEDQSTAIGRRNVHTLKAGSRFTIGGGSSDYLIFLVPLPPSIGELRFDGKNCTLVPLKPKYFPDIGSYPVNECIGKTIRIMSDKGYEIFFHFERYQDPLTALNKLLYSIRVPEPTSLPREA